MPSENYWMGGTDMFSEGNWVWITGESWNFSVWASGGYWQSWWWWWWGQQWITTFSEPDGGINENHLAGRVNSNWILPLGSRGWSSDDGNSPKPNYILEFGAYSSATLRDTDGDGSLDGTEIAAGSDPNNSQDTPALRATPFAGLDVPDEAGSWTFGGPNWTTRPVAWMSHDGQDTAASSSADDQTSWMERTIQGPAYVDFWWRGSSEQFYDFFSYSVDGTIRERYSGERGWQKVSLFLTAGSHTIRWSYEKDGSFASGEDAVFVDELSIIPAVADLRVSQAGGPVSSPWLIEFGSVLEGSAFVDRTVTLSNQGNLGMSLGVSVPVGSGFQILNAPTRLEPNQSVDVTVRMPTFVVGTKSTFLTISAPGSATPPPLIQLTGDVRPKVAIMELTQGGNPVSSLASYALGNLPRTIEFTIRNLGTDTLRPVVAVLSGEVTTVAGSVTEVAPGECGTLTLYFSSTTAGAKTAEISLLTNDANRADTRITLTGTSVLPNSGARGVALGQTGGGTGWQVGSGVELTVTGGANNSQSYLEATYQGPGLLSWSWKTQIQEGNDVLACAVNGVEIASVTKKKGSWESQVATLPEGLCAVRWFYAKDSINWTGTDRVWLSGINYRPFTGPRMTWQQWLASRGVSSQGIQAQSVGSSLNQSLTAQVAGGLPALLAYLGGVDPIQGPPKGEYQAITTNNLLKYRYGVSKAVSGNLMQRPAFSSSLTNWSNQGFTQQIVSEDANRIVVEVSMPTDGITRGFYRVDAMGTMPGQ